MQLIDTHCHLDHEYFKGEREQVVERAHAAGVTCWVNPSLSFKNIPTVLALTEQYEGCYAGAGIYPRYCYDWHPADIDRVRQAAQHKKVVAIGEIGLDYYFNIKASKETQFDRIVLETDAPCMPPHPYRDAKRSEPAHVRVVAEAVAAIHNKRVEEIAEITTQNARRLFAI